MRTLWMVVALTLVASLELRAGEVSGLPKPAAPAAAVGSTAVDVRLAATVLSEQPVIGAAIPATDSTAAVSSEQSIPPTAARSIAASTAPVATAPPAAISDIANSSGKDAAPNSTPALNFGEAYSRILERSLDIQNQALNVEISRTQKLGRIGAFTPQLALVATSSSQTAGDQLSYQGSKTAVLAASANLFRSGTDFAALKGANHDVDASIETLSDQKLKAEDDAAKVLIDFISRTRERELILQIVTLKQETVKIARERYTRGLLARQEVDKTQIDLDIAQARLVDADTLLAAARATVSARLGAFQSVNLVWPWKSVIETETRFEKAEFKLENRPDIRAALQTRAAEDWRRHAARSRLLPSLDLSANYGSFDLTQIGRRDWSALFTLTIPLFERFEGWSAAHAQNLRLQQADITREATARNAIAEIEAYRTAYAGARDSAVARERTARLTQGLFSDNLQRFRLGRASANELSVDQQRLLDAEILEVEGWSNAHLSFIRLCHALGRTMTAAGHCE